MWIRRVYFSDPGLGYAAADWPRETAPAVADDLQQFAAGNVQNDDGHPGFRA